MIIKDTAIIYKRAELCNEIRDDKYEIELDLNHKDIGVGMSGGMDSSLLLWLLAHHISENELDTTKTIRPVRVVNRAVAIPLANCPITFFMPSTSVGSIDSRFEPPNIRIKPRTVPIIPIAIQVSATNQNFSLDVLMCLSILYPIRKLVTNQIPIKMKQM